MLLNKKLPYLIQQTFIMTVLTLCKFVALYYITENTKAMLPAVIRTFILLLALYSLANLVLSRRWFSMRLLFHELLALIVLSDLLYFRYFNVLPSITDIQFLKVLPEIKKSIASLFNPVFLLFFADILPLLLHHFHMKAEKKSSDPRALTALAFAMVFVFLAFTDFSLNKIKSSGQAYARFGLLHYHFSQLPGVIGKEDTVNDKDEFKEKANSTEKIKKVNHKLEIKKVEAPPRYFGAAKGRNVIVIQVEALQDFVINMKYNGQVLTPNLNRLLTKDTIYFNRFYQQLGKGGTSDAEFVTQNSLYPSMDLPAYSKYQNNKFMGLPMILRDNGFNTMAFHAYKPEFWNRQTIYPVLGYDRFVNMNDFNRDEIFGWGLSDKHFFWQSAAILGKTKQPFYSFLVTLSSHHPYALPKKYKKIQLKPENQGKMLGNYLQAINYTDEAIGTFIDQLQQRGLYENSIITIYGDHRAIPNGVAENDKQMAGLLGHVYTYDESLNVPLIIHLPGSGINETNITVGGQMDFLPTMLNLLGIREKRIKLFGQDLLNAESGFVASQTQMIKGSFIDDYKIFVMSRDGVFEHAKAWDLSSREPVDLELCRDGYERALRDIQESEYILANDLIQEFVTMGETDTAFSNAYRKVNDLMDRIVILFKSIVKQ